MRELGLARRLASGGPVVCGWSGLSDPLIGEAIAAAGFEAVCVDCQHGHQGLEMLKATLLGIVAGGAAPVMRIPLDDVALGARALDLGFEAVIAPMVNSRADAEHLVDALKYPPLGNRSWGPARMMHVWNHDGATLDANTWLGAANGLQLVLAMIETGAAVEAAGDIAAVEGIDGLFIGPADLSISLSGGTAVDPQGADVVAAMDTVAEACATHGKLATGYAQSGEIAANYRARGFRLIAGGTDYGYIREGARAKRAELGG